MMSCALLKKLPPATEQCIQIARACTHTHTHTHMHTLKHMQTYTYTQQGILDPNADTVPIERIARYFLEDFSNSQAGKREWTKVCAVLWWWYSSWHGHEDSTVGLYIILYIYCGDDTVRDMDMVMYSSWHRHDDSTVGLYFILYIYCVIPRGLSQFRGKRELCAVICGWSSSWSSSWHEDDRLWNDSCVGLYVVLYIRVVCSDMWMIKFVTRTW